MSVQKERVRRRFLFFIFSLFLSQIYKKSDRKLLLEQKAKLVYVERATHRYQYLSLLSNVKMYEIFSICIISSLKAM